MKIKILNQKGSLALQFSIGFMLVMALIMVLFYLSLTLVVAELVQYSVYSSSRYLFLGDVNEDAQKTAAKERYITLLRSDSGIFKTGFWGDSNSTKMFFIPEQITPSFNTNMPYEGLPPLISTPDSQFNPFYGVWINFVPNVLKFDSFWFGETTEEQPETKFKTTIGSYLGREPSKTECEAFFANRKSEIFGFITSRPTGAPTISHFTAPVSDNGC